MINRTKRVDGAKGHDVDDWTQSLLAGGGYVDTSGGAAIKRSRLTFAFVVVAILGALLLYKTYDLQVASASQYELRAKGNSVRDIIDYAPRGRIYDRTGTVIADNKARLELNLTPFLVPRDETERDELITEVAAIFELTPEDIHSKIQDAGINYARPVVISSNVAHQQVLKFHGSSNKFDGFVVDDIPSRKYVLDAGISHLVGYVGRVSKIELDADPTDTLLLTDFIGKSGIEKSFDTHLRGVNGRTRYEVDALGRPVRVIEHTPAIAGKDLHLGLDLKTQIGMYQAMLEQLEKSGSTKASGVAVHPGTGQLLAMVSLPTFDNNLLSNGISTSDYAEIIENTDQPLFNKVISGGYTSGSVVKPMVAAAALEEGVVNERTIIEDRGYIDVYGQFGGVFRFRGWREGGLGPMDVRSALAWSSNIYFYTVAGGYGDQDGLGAARLTSYYKQFGLGESTQIKLPSENQGRVPDADWKQRQFSEPWYVGDTYNISIGQGDMLVSPLQITVAGAAVINDGNVLVPKLAKDDATEVRKRVAVSKDNFKIVREGMRQVLTDGTTCECLFNNVPVAVAGKSGTAETNTPDGKAPHSWFMGFAPYDNPEILATVLVEEAGSGSAYAAPAVAKTLESYFTDD